MKLAWKKLVAFVEREWFLLVVLLAISIIVLLFEFL
jgi:hypothetical protein